MIHYETLMLLHSEVTGDELSKLEISIDKIITDSKGEINIFDPWGKCRLAYPVEKNDYGIYILIRYWLPKEELSPFFKEFHNALKIKFNDIVLRYVDVKLRSDAVIDYPRPDVLEAQNVGNLDSFLKKNKIESFLSQEKDDKEINDDIDNVNVKEKIEIEVESSRQSPHDTEEKNEAVESERGDEIAKS